MNLSNNHQNVHLQLIAVFLVISSCLLDSVSGECKEIRIRRNFMSLSNRELSEYVKVFRTMYNRGIFEQLAIIHTNNFATIHDYPQFLLWHRYFVWDFEQKMQQINPDLTLPYWDGAADFSAPHLSRVFLPEAFGGNGDAFNRYCIRDGFLSSININYPQSDCLKRDFQGPGRDSIQPWHSPAFITSLIQTSSTFDDFRANIEHTLHNSIHFGIGGYYGDFSKHYSPIDAIFFVHHANIDRIYAKWQLSHPHHLDSIDGLQLDRNGRLQTITPSFQLDHYNIRVGDILRTIEEPLCYTYDDIIDQKPSLTNKVENRLRQLPRRLLLKYFPKFVNINGVDERGDEFDDDEAGVDHDFPNTRSLSQALNSPLPTPIMLPKDLFKKMGFNLTRGLEVQRKVNKFVQDMNRRKFIKHKNMKKTQIEKDKTIKPNNFKD